MRAIAAGIIIALIGSLVPMPLADASLAAHVVISEVAINVGGAANEFVELYNPTDVTIDLAALPLKLHAVNSSGSSDTNKTLSFLTTTIPAHGFFLIASTGYITASGITADATYAASSNGLVGDGAVYISTSATAGTSIIDALDYGADTPGVGEGATSADISNNQSLERKSGETHDEVAGNGWDTDDHAADFVARTTPEPQTSAAEVEPLASGGGESGGDGDGDSGGGAGGGGGVIDTTAPTDGGVLTATVDDGEVFLSWSAGSDDVGITSYELTRSADGGATWGTPTDLGNVLTTTVSSLANGTSYAFRIRAVDAAGNRSLGLTVAATPAAPPSAGEVVVNELVSHPSAGDEWVECFNATSEPRLLAGLTIADNTGVIHTFPVGTVIAAGGYAVVDLSSKLNNSGDIVMLKNGATIIDSVTYGDYDDGDASDNHTTPGTGEALARRPDGGEVFSIVASPTRAAANPAAPTRAASVSLLITEVDFKNTTADYAEIYVADDGAGGEGVDLGGFTFADDGVFKTIADGTSVRTGDYILFTFDSIAADEVAATDGILHLYTSHTGLVSTDEQLILADGYDAVEDTVAWASISPTDAEASDLAALIAAGGWSDAAISSADVGTGKVVARKFLEGAYVDTNGAADFVVRAGSPGVANTNTPPTAVITIQSAASCSLSVNLDGSGSADVEGDALSYAWDFGDGHTSTSANPDYHTFATAGTYVVRLTVTDGVGASSAASQSFTVASCGGGGGTRLTKVAEPVIESISADRVRLLITEVSFYDTPDWVEVFVADDGVGGAGVDLGGFTFEDDKRFKTIPRGFTARTGEYFTLTFKSEAADDATSRRLFTERDGLTKTDEQLILRDSRGTVEDAVVWGDQSGGWSRGEDDDVAALASVSAWARFDETGAIDSRVVEKGWSVARRRDVSAYVDTQFAADFFATPFPTGGFENDSPPTKAADVRLLITAVDFKNPTGDSLTLACVDCALTGTDLTGFFVKLADTTIFTFPRGVTMRAGEVMTLRYDKESAAPVADALRLTSALTGADGLISIKDFAETTEDFVCWTDRTAPRGRAYDLTIAEVTQLEKRAWEGQWSGETPASCLDSREVKKGQMIARIRGEDEHFIDTDASSDWGIVGVATEETIVKMTSKDIHLTEILANPTGQDPGVEWWEVANLGARPVELAGWSAVIGRSSFTFEDSLILAPGAYRAITGLPIRNGGGTLQLIDPFDVVIDEVAYPELPEETAYARTSRGWEATTAPTRGLPNGGFLILARTVDADADGLAADEEQRLGTDLARFDTDGDGLPDGFEVRAGLDPRVADATESARSAYRLDLTRLATGSLAAAADETTGFRLTGRGVPGGSVRLFIQSELRIVDVAVDADGRFAYSLDVPLERGSHNVFLQAFDPAGFASVTSKVLSFARLTDFVPPTYADLRLSEMLPNPAGKDAGSEFVEVENLSSIRASLAGWQIRVGRKTLTLDGDIAPRGYDVARISLPNDGGEVHLIRPDGRVMETVTYPRMKEDVAFAIVDGVWRETARPTPDAANIFANIISKKRAKKAKVTYRNGDLSSDIVISEVLPNPIGSDTKAEWIEIQNVGTQTVRLGNYRLDDSEGGSKPFLIPDAVVLAPGAYHFFRRPETKLSLNNTGAERVRLFDYRGQLVSEVAFADVPEGSALARDGDAYRATRLPTPGTSNAFDTLRLTGIVRHVGVEGFLIETVSGEVWIAFAERGPSLVARAVLAAGMHLTAFVAVEGGRYTLDDFTADTAPVILSSEPTFASLLIFVVLAVVVAFIGITSRDRLRAFLPTSR